MPKLNKKQTSFVKNAAILSFAGIFSRMIGALYRIPLYRLISDEGNGLYSTGYNIYAMLLAISATGIPVAISKLVSEEISKNRMEEAKRIFRIAATLLTIIGFVVTIILIFTAPFIARIIGDSRTVYPLIAVAPAIFIVALMASFRGYFQGLQMMWPTAISQVSEQIARVITVLVLVWYMVSINARVEYTAAAASFGSAVGSLIGLAVILFIYFKSKPYLDIKAHNSKNSVSNRTTRQIIIKILRFAIPITIGAMVIPIMNGIDTVLVPGRLQSIGYTEPQSMALYGRLTGVVPLINLPSMLAYALAASLVPAISTASAEGKWKAVQSRARFAIKLILMIGFPAAVGLSLLATPITLMLYNDIMLAPILKVLAFAVIFLTLHQTCSGILQGLGHTSIPVKNLIIGGVIKIMLNYTLIAIPSINIIGAAFSSVVAYGISSTLNIRAVFKHTGMRIKWLDMIIKPLVATGVMALTVAGIYNGLVHIAIHNAIATLLAIGGGMLVYGLGLLITRCFSESELKTIPYIGESIFAIAKRWNCLRRSDDE